MADDARAEEREEAGGGAEQPPVARIPQQPADREAERAGEERRVDEEADDAGFGRDLEEVVVRVLRSIFPRELRRQEVRRIAEVTSGADAEIRVRADDAEARHD